MSQRYSRPHWLTLGAMLSALGCSAPNDAPSPGPTPSTATPVEPRAWLQQLSSRLARLEPDTLKPTASGYQLLTPSGELAISLTARDETFELRARSKTLRIHRVGDAVARLEASSGVVHQMSAAP